MQDPQTTPITSAPPPIGQPWTAQGGTYAGIVRGRDGQPDRHMVLADARPNTRLNWQAAMAWAAGVEVDGHTDFSLPDRYQSAVLFGNLDDQFEKAWYWTSTPASEGYAWYQLFSYGLQSSNLTSYEGRARAVRLIPLGS